MSAAIKDYYLLCTAYNGGRTHIAAASMYGKKEVGTYFVPVDRGIAPAETVIGGRDQDNKILVL